MKCWYNGAFLPAEKCRIEAQSDAVLYGSSVFESLRTANGRLPFWDRHLQRLKWGARTLEIPLHEGLDDAAAIVTQLLDYNGIKEGRVRVTLCTASTLASDLIIKAERWDEAVAPAAATLAEFPRNERSPLVSIKSGNYLESQLAWRRARGMGFDEAIFVNTKGELCEGSRSNLFVFSETDLVTPSEDSGLLAGITRAIVMEEAVDLGMRVREERMNPALLAGCREAFLTNSVVGIRPLVRFNECAIGDGKPGESTLSLARALERRIQEEA